jgi:hypothetical protein
VHVLEKLIFIVCLFSDEESLNRREKGRNKCGSKKGMPSGNSVLPT